MKSSIGATKERPPFQGSPLLRCLILPAFLSSIFAAAAAAGPFEDGMAAFSRGDNQAAIKIWIPLASQGNVRTQSMLGYAYEVSQNLVEAARWYRAAADQGNAVAQTNLAMMHQNGRGVGRDYVEALKLYRLAADQGVAVAQFNLGLLFAGGQGVQRDYVQAHKWLTLAAEGFPAAEAARSASALRNRDIAASKMTAGQIAEAQKLVREWKPNSAK